MPQLIRTALRFVASFSVITLSSLPVCAQEQERAARVYADASKSVLLLVVRSEQGEVLSQGTGFVVEGGKVITNEHVARNGRVFIDLGAARLATTVERTDTFNDLALLSTSAELAVKPLMLAAATPSPGMSVFAIGNPSGLERSISSGVVSGIRTLGGRQLIQITAPISPGSSGGPILNVRGEVVGVAVGVLEKGQNLNFAVPAAQVRKLLSGEVPSGGDALLLLERARDLNHERAQLGFSVEVDSPWQRSTRQFNTVLVRALEAAGNDPVLLAKVAEQAGLWHEDIAIEAAERAVRAKPTAQSFLLLGKTLSTMLFVAEEAERALRLERAESAMRSAFRLTKQPTVEMYYHLADVLEDRGSVVEAEGYFRRALELSERTGNEMRAPILRGLVRTADLSGSKTGSDVWFKALVDTGKAHAWDWESNAKRLQELGKFEEAGQSYRQSAVLGGSWQNWCKAARVFAGSSTNNDDALACARKCIAEGEGKKGSETHLGSAHSSIAGVLNSRGVHQEALGHAREATVLRPSDPFAFKDLAEALIGLRRFQEAINASIQAIRLSDGKYSYMHFSLGSAYFETENWELAKQSYEKAAQLDPKDTAAPYNVALCLSRLRYYRDAAKWLEEVLRRDPNHRDRQEILRRIQVLRQ